MKRNLFQKLSPPQVLIIGFAVAILLGGILLSTPWVTRSGKGIGLLNGLFTSATSVCVTGLVVVDTGTVFNTIGLGIILLLIQVGGLGFMTMASAFFIALHRRITLKERMVIGESFNTSGTLAGLVRLVKRAVAFTFAVEAAGALFLSIRMIPLFGLSSGLGTAAFLAVSAFCNAGIDPLGNYASLTGFLGDPLVNAVIMLLVVLGGIGFGVISDVWGNRNGWKKLSLNSKTVLGVTGGLLAAGFLVYTACEWNNPATMGGLSPMQKLMAGLFQSVTTRTAGFNTISQSGLTAASKVFTMILMFIGASPASTGGGIKTTTFFVLLLTVRAIVRGRQDTELMGRRIPRDVVRRAAAIAVIAGGVICIISCMLCIIEAGTSPMMTLENILMETFSAMGTVGLSCGITPYLRPVSKVLLIVAMFFGRLGPLTIAFGLSKREKNGSIRYPEGRLMVG